MSAAGAPPARVGVISDTHGLLRPRALYALRGCDLIIHGGDIGGESVMHALRALAPVTAVRGNNDTDAWAAALPVGERIQVGDTAIYAIHKLAELDLDPVAAGIQVVVCGHSHQPSIERRDGVLFLNPGSAGPRRFNLPVTAALLRIDGTAVTAELVDLAP